MLPRHHSRRISAHRGAQDAFSAGLFGSASIRIPTPERKLSMILAPLAAAALLVSVAIAPNAPNPAESPTLSMHQKTAAMHPLLRFATECIARAVSAHPRFGASNADLGDLIVDSMPRCAVQVRMMIEAYDRYFGDGEGEAFFMGPYLDLLPGAVSKWVRDTVRGRGDWPAK